MTSVDESAVPAPAASDPGHLDWDARLLAWAPYAGAAVGAAAVTVFLILMQERSGLALSLLASIGALFSGGKEASLPLATSLGVPAWLAGTMILLVDLAVMAVMFPIFVRGLDRLGSTKGFVGHLLRAAQQHARRYLPWVHRWGSWGLFVFMLVPFAFNGPPQGIVLGRLAGLRVSQVGAAVTGAILVTTLAWTMVGYYAKEWLVDVNPRLPLYVALGITAAVIGIALVSFIQERRRNGTA